MLKARRQAADLIAADLFKAEASVSAAVEDVATLVRTIHIARRSANLSATVGSDPATRAIASLKALGKANQELVHAHESLAKTKIQVGLGAVAIGAGGGDKPDDDAVVQRAPIGLVG